MVPVATGVPQLAFMRILAIWACILLVVLAACGDDATPPAGDAQQDTATETIDDALDDGGDDVVGDVLPDLPDAGALSLAGRCDRDARRGGFLVEDGERFSLVEGTVNDRGPPVPLRDVGGDANCRLLRRDNPLCDPPCEAGQACAIGGVCSPFPVPLDVGAVWVDGLVQPVMMTPLQPGNSYFDTQLPNPAQKPSETVRLRVSGGADVPAATLHGIGAESIVSMTPEWVLDADEDLVIRWQAPTQAHDGQQIVAQLAIDQHGASPVRLVCRFEDTGQGTVTADLAAQLIDAGVSGFPSGTLSRETADHVGFLQPEAQACLDLVVRSHRAVDVRAAGFVPCTTQQDCPSGLSCNTVIELCE